MLRAHLRDRLPPYMVPAYLEHLDVIPMTTSDKADRKACRAPSAPARRPARELRRRRPAPTETVLAELLAATLGARAGLGRQPLLRRPRRRTRCCWPGSPRRSREQTDAAADLDAGHVPAPHGHGARPLAARSAPADARRRCRTGRGDVAPRHGRATCCAGRLQLCCSWFGSYLGALLLVTGLEWLAAATGVRRHCGSARSCSAPATFAGSFAAADRGEMAARRALEGRRSSRSGAWRYLRFWLVKTLIAGQPAGRCSSGRRSTTCTCGRSAPGSGAGAVVLSRNVPVCTDLLTDRRRHRHPQGHALHRLPGRRRTHPDRPGHASAPTRSSASTRSSTSTPRWATARSSATPRRCRPGRRSRTAQSWHGSPAAAAATSTTGWSPPARCGRLRRFAYSVWQLLNVLVLVRAARPRALVLQFLEYIPLLPRLMQPGHDGGRRPGRSTCRCSAISRRCSFGAC